MITDSLSRACSLQRHLGSSTSAVYAVVPERVSSSPVTIKSSRHIYLLYIAIVAFTVSSALCTRWMYHAANTTPGTAMLFWSSRVHGCVQAACGFSKIMLLLKDARKPVVGHSCLYDIVFVLTQFVQTYDTWPEFQKGVQEYFPAGIYDTRQIWKKLNLETTCNTLGELYQTLCDSKEGYKHMDMLQNAGAHTSTKCGSHHMPG
jgi:hypothetical protein